MKNFAVIFVLSIATSLSACWGNMKMYKLEDIEIISFERLTSGDTEIVYQPILDSLYYCPGAGTRQEGGRQKVSFVRCGIKEKCEVDALASSLAQGKWKLVLPSPPESIDLVFSDGEVRLIE